MTHSTNVTKYGLVEFEVRLQNELTSWRRKEFGWGVYIYPKAEVPACSAQANYINNY